MHPFRIPARLPVELALGGTALAAAAATLSYATLSSGSQLFGRTIIAGRDPNQVALTFDDGPNDAATDDLLDLLERYQTRATFFMIGRFVRQRPQIVRRVHAAGHLIGNHTETHPWLSHQPAKIIRQELRACNQALEDVIGAPVRYFRPPHGARRPAVFHAAEELELKLVQWNAMGKDWKPIGPERILANLEADRRRAQRKGAGTNVLLHDGHDRGMGARRSDTLKVTEQLLERFARERAETVTVDVWDVTA